ncbi:MAG: Uncharacterized protein F082_1144 [bacterium F082]|nr:MAG: Uncharacterized protein F082_1144 [bacterium F082]KWW28499.1 MAG: Uncharacterized protein AUK64_1638 [bacterium P201]
METLILAIDFGTTTTIVCGDISGVGNPLFIKDNNSPLIPSVIYIMEDGRKIYGKFAEIKNDEAQRGKGKLVENFKLGLISNDKILREQSKMYIKDFFANHIFKLYRQQKTDFPHHDKMIVRISHPSKWSPELCDFMVDSVKSSGFNCDVETIPEPLAISSYSLRTYQEELRKLQILEYEKVYNVLICDMGGGTTDIVLCKLIVAKDGKISIIESATYPEEGSQFMLGGSEIDLILSNYIQSRCNVSSKIFNVRHARLWKEQYVSKDLEIGCEAITPSRVADILSQTTDILNVDELGAIDRFKFEDITKGHWGALKELIEKSVNDYNLKYKEFDSSIDFVFLTGGHSQWYCIKEVIASLPNKFDKVIKEPARLINCPNPNETVARGLCCFDFCMLKSNNIDKNNLREKNSHNCKETITESSSHSSFDYDSWKADSIWNWDLTDF